MGDGTLLDVFETIEIMLLVLMAMPTATGSFEEKLQDEW